MVDLVVQLSLGDMVEEGDQPLDETGVRGLNIEGCEVTWSLSTGLQGEYGLVEGGSLIRGVGRPVLS